MHGLHRLTSRRFESRSIGPGRGQAMHHVDVDLGRGLNKVSDDCSCRLPQSGSAHTGWFNGNSFVEKIRLRI